MDKGVFESALQRNALLADTASQTAERLVDLREEAHNYMTQSPAWYKFRRSILVYHTITDSWTEIADSPLLARAGAGVTPVGSRAGSFSALVIGGEEKPGVRSSDVTRVDVSYDAHFGWLNWTVLILYLLAMVYLGFYFMRRASNSSDDFFKGGGRIPWWAAGISIFATMLSAITYMSIPAKAYATDWTYYPMQICILLVSLPVIRYYLPFFRRLNVTTAYEYLERRFNSATRVMASILFIVFMIARTALVLFLPSLAMTAVTGINIYMCIALMALITILYCSMGGVEAVIWGDVIQGINEKMIYRHPHVFGDLTPDEVDWDKLKAAEKHSASLTDELHRIPKDFPALMASEKIQKKLANSGWRKTDEAFDLKQVRGAADALEGADKPEQQAEALQKMLAAAADLARLNHLQPELLLKEFNDRMIDEQEFLPANLEAGVSVPHKFDLAISVECAEHLSPNAADGFVASLCKASDIILFSAAHPGQGGEHHVNEQPMTYWGEKFQQHGFLPIHIRSTLPQNDPRILWWYRDNIILFVKRDVYDSIVGKIEKC